jgi:hypothetical protein
MGKIPIIHQNSPLAWSSRIWIYMTALVYKNLKICYSANLSTIFKFESFSIIKLCSNATCIGSSNFCIEVMPSKFILMKIIHGENFGQLFRFFPKGLMPIKIQTKFKYWLLPKFVTQKPFGIWICPQKEHYSPLYIFFTPKSVVIFCSGRADLSIYKVCLGEKKMGKFKLLGRPTCRPSACSNATCLGPPVSDPSCPLAPATGHRRIAVAPHASYHRVQDGVGSTRPHCNTPCL